MIKKAMLISILSLLMFIPNAKAEEIDNINCINGKILLNNIEYPLVGINYDTVNEDICPYLTGKENYSYEIEDNKIYLYSEDDSLSLLILSEGLAKVQLNSYVNESKEFCEAEKEARDSMKGVWSGISDETSCTDRYLTSSETKIITEESSEEAKKWGVKESTLSVILRFLLAFVVGGFILFIKFFKPLKKRLHK